MPQNSATFSFEDFDTESSNHAINIGPLTAVNFVAVRDAVNDYETALQGIVLGELRKTTINEQFQISNAAVSTANAQRETKWLVAYRDITQYLDVANTISNVGFGNIYTVEIPTADLSLLTTPGNPELDLAAPAVAAFVTAFEAIQNSPTGGNETQVVRITHVGRNL